MGVYQCYAACVRCRQPFFFNPHLVPSITFAGTRQPICAACVEAVNPKRRANGLDPIIPLPGAYDPADEAEWGEGEWVDAWEGDR